MVAAQFATVGEQNEADGAFKGIAPADLAEFYGATMRALSHEHSRQPFLFD